MADTTGAAGEGNTNTPVAQGQQAGAPDAANQPQGGAGDQGAGNPGSTLLTQKPADQAAAGTQDGGEGEGGQGDKPAGAPAEYAAFKVPEGIVLDEGQLQEFTGLAREAGLSQEQAQKLVDFHLKGQSDAEERWKQTVSDWEKQVREDKDIGGAKLDGVLAEARKVIVKYATPGFIEFMETGWGNNPDVVKTIYAMAKDLNADKLGDPGQLAPSGQQSEEAGLRQLYPSMYEPREKG